MNQKTVKFLHNAGIVLAIVGFIAPYVGILLHDHDISLRRIFIFGGIGTVVIGANFMLFFKPSKQEISPIPAFEIPQC